MTAQGGDLLAWLDAAVAQAERTPGLRREAKGHRRLLEAYAAAQRSAQEPEASDDVVALLNADMSAGLDAIESAAARRAARRRLEGMASAVALLTVRYGWTGGER